MRSGPDLYAHGALLALQAYEERERGASEADAASHGLMRCRSPRHGPSDELAPNSRGKGLGRFEFGPSLQEGDRRATDMTGVGRS
jgi:hypothetical protein